MFTDNEFNLEDEAFDQVAQARAKDTYRRGRIGWPQTPDLDDFKNEEDIWLDSFVHEL